MRINSDRLGGHLQKSLQPFYWIAGDETLLVMETLDQLRGHCRQHGFSEWEQLFADRYFDWQTLLQTANSMSLFAERRIIEVRLNTAKVDEAARAVLQKYLASPNPDNVLILVTPKLESASLNTKWFKTLEAGGVFVQVWPVDVKALPGWIESRLARHGLSADAEAVTLLTDRVEGNLLAANQEIEKLRILTGASTDNRIRIGQKHVMSLVADHSRFNVFTLIDAALYGDAQRAQKVLDGLRADGNEPLALLGMLARELRQLIEVRALMEGGQDISSALQKKGIRRIHEAPVKAALRRLHRPQLEDILRGARQVDQAVKGMSPENPWTALSNLVLALAGLPPVVAGLTAE